MEHFFPAMDKSDINKISMLGLAHIGDGVYELLVRTMLCRRGYTSVGVMHRQAVSYVNAPAQAEAVKKILPMLDGDELDIYRRGRNTKVNSVPQNAELAEYHAATGLEALFGWLYLSGRTERIDELFAAIIGEE